MKNKFSSVFCLEKKYSKLNKLDFILLLCFATKKSKEFILAHPEYTLNIFQYTQLTYFVWKYKRGFPIAYLTHHKEFCDLDFYVNKHTLIPRPETELMVEEAVYYINEQITTNYEPNILMIDVGTGSGCIPISILKKLEYKNLKTIATDISIQALNVAKKNATTHNVNINFLQGNLLEPILKNNSTIRHRVNTKIILTANLPYLTLEQIENEPSIQKESIQALLAHENGLGLYKQLLQQIKKLIAYSLSLTTFFEIDPSQTRAIASLIKKSFPQTSVEIKKDLKNQDRLVSFYTLNL